MPIVHNSKEKSVVFRETSNASYTLASLATGGETLTGVAITKVEWSGNWTVRRGANTILVLSGEHGFDFHGWAALNEFPAANLVFETGTTPGVIILQVNKTTDPEQ